MGWIELSVILQLDEVSNYIIPAFLLAADHVVRQKDQYLQEFSHEESVVGIMDRTERGIWICT